VRPRIIEWDGTNVPEELRQLPPGRYLIGSAYELWDEEPTPEEEAGIQHALDQAEAGQVRQLDEVMREIRSRVRHPLKKT
jgi:hypothetical protein